MMTADPVVLALRAALLQSDSAEIRLALGEHLLRKGEVSEALVEFEAGLAIKPDDRAILTGAAEAAALAGDHARAEAYRLASGSGATKGESKREMRLVAVDGKLLEEPSTHHQRLGLADVIGMEKVKAALRSAFLGALENPEVYRRYGKRSSGGLILFGPPGCGKTFVARALAGGLGARFINVGLTDVMDMWFGESESRLHSIFEEARQSAPCVLFFDEIDALAQRRSQLRGSAGRTLVNQLLVELDGFEGRPENVFVLAATNHPWDLDPALQRPGRFDRTIFVPPPNAAARARTLASHLEGKPVATGLDCERLAGGMQYYSSADVVAVVDRAVELAIEESIASGRDQPIDRRLLEAAMRDVRPTIRPWLETARNFALYANQGGAYDDLLAYLKETRLA